MPIDEEETGNTGFLNMADLKRHLNIDPQNGMDDALVRSKLDAARDWVAAFTGAELTAATPSRVKEAILMLAAHLFNNRETVLVGITAQQLPFGLLDMLADYRAWCA